MSVIIAMCGLESVKLVGSREERVVPFVGADRGGEWASMGVGIILPDQGRKLIWGLLSPHRIIQSWRAMKLLEQMPEVKYETLCDCWTVMRRPFWESEKIHRDRLVELVGDNKLRALQAELLASVPMPGETRVMIKNFAENGVDVISDEFGEEIALGHSGLIPAHDMLKTEPHRRYQQRLAPKEAAPPGFFRRILAFHF